jgi:hypothetical protein
MKTLNLLDSEILQELLRLHLELEPENLSCDGEISREQISKRYSETKRSLDKFLRDQEIEISTGGDSVAVIQEHLRRGSLHQ